MTIHQAKGLEFPVVIVADMDRPSRAEGKRSITRVRADSSAPGRGARGDLAAGPRDAQRCRKEGRRS